MPNVYVPNRSFHDFREASKYGKLIFLTEGTVKRQNVNQLYRECSDKMRDASPDDYICISSLALLNAIAASIMAYRFGRVNFLIFKGGDYVAREIVLGGMLDYPPGPRGEMNDRAD